MFTSRHGARTSLTAVGRFTVNEKRPASPTIIGNDIFAKRPRDEPPMLNTQASVGIELFGMSSSQLLIDVPVFDDLFGSPKSIERSSTGEKVRLEMNQLYKDFNAGQLSNTVVESPPPSPPNSTPPPTMEELLTMSMVKPPNAFSPVVRASSPVLGVPTSQPGVMSSQPMITQSAGVQVSPPYMWAPSTAPGYNPPWPGHFAVTAKSVTVVPQQGVGSFGGVWQEAPQVSYYSVPQQVVSQQMVFQQAEPQVVSYSPNLPMPPVSPFVAYSSVPISTPLPTTGCGEQQQMVSQQVEPRVLSYAPQERRYSFPISTSVGGGEQQQMVSSVAPRYVPVSRMRGDGADSFFVEPALENIDSNRRVMKVLGSGSDEEVREMWNFCITSPGTDHSCKQAVDVALHMRCACHLMATGVAKSYVDVCRQLGMLADRKCLNGCVHKHACQVGTFYCIACVRAEKHEVSVEECLEKWIAAGSPIRHGTQV